jgi:AAA15 family ATPase/GTPase
MIQHIRIDFPPIIEGQILKDLGRVNILTGRNSSGKSTILRSILDKPNIGYDFINSTENKDLLKSFFRLFNRPNEHEVDNWIDHFLKMLTGKMVFNTSKKEIGDILTEAKFAASFNYSVENVFESIANSLTSNNTIDKEDILLLSPKRRLPYSTAFNTINNKLDDESTVGLARLFYLNNQLPDNKDKKLFEKISDSFLEITGSEFSIQIIPNQQHGNYGIQLLFRKSGGTWIEAINEGQGMCEILSIILYSLDGNYKLVLIEEPKNHVHPDFQRKLLCFLNHIDDRQFILSTHSPVFLNQTMVDRIYFCKYSEGKILISDNTCRAEALSNLGVLAVDNLTSDAVLITEGITDQYVIDYILKKWLKAPINASISYPFCKPTSSHFSVLPFSS